MLKLSDVLKHVGERIKQIGKVYTTTNTVAVPNVTSKRVAQLTLPAGIYVVTAAVSWPLDRQSALTVISIGGANLHSVTVRDTMWAGGGSCATAVYEIQTETIVALSAYQSAGTSVNASARISAIRIK